MLNDARPVRIVAMSCCRSESAFSILVLMLASISFTELNTGPLGAACCSVFIAMCLRNAFRLMNYSADGFPIDICIIPACIPESSFVSRTNRLPEETVRAKGKREKTDRGQVPPIRPMGGDDSQKLLPWRGTYSSPGRGRPPAHVNSTL